MLICPQFSTYKCDFYPLKWAFDESSNLCAIDIGKISISSCSPVPNLQYNCGKLISFQWKIFIGSARQPSLMPISRGKLCFNHPGWAEKVPISGSDPGLGVEGCCLIIPYELFWALTAPKTSKHHYALGCALLRGRCDKMPIDHIIRQIDSPARGVTR